MRSCKINLKRVYDSPAREDGLRVLVDRLWPRGLSKNRARIHLWVPDVAPGTALRKWFGHDAARWPEFRRRYRRELRDAGPALGVLRAIVRRARTITLLYAAKCESANNAIVLREALCASGPARREAPPRPRRRWEALG